MKPFHYHRAYKQEQIDSRNLDTTLFKRLWNYLQPYRLWISLSIFFIFLSRGIEAFVPIAIGQVTQKILNSVNASLTLKNEMMDYVITACIGIMLLLILSYCLEAANVFLKSWIGQKALYKLRNQVYDHILHMPLNYYDHHAVGRLMTRTIHDVDQINQMFAESIVPIIGNIILFFSILVGLFIIDWKIALVACALLPLVGWLTINFRDHQRISYEKVRTIVSGMNTFVQEHLMGAFTIRNFGLEKKERVQFEEINEDHCTANLESIHNFAFFIAAIDVLQSFSLIMVFVVLVLFAAPETGFQAGTFLHSASMPSCSSGPWQILQSAIMYCKLQWPQLSAYLMS